MRYLGYRERIRENEERLPQSDRKLGHCNNRRPPTTEQIVPMEIFRWNFRKMLDVEYSNVGESDVFLSGLSDGRAVT